MTPLRFKTVIIATMFGLLPLVGCVSAATPTTPTMPSGPATSNTTSSPSPSVPATAGTLEAQLNRGKTVLGVQVPVPTYFPSGYGIGQIDAAGDTVTIHISKDASIGDYHPSPDEISLQIQWLQGGPIGIKFPGVMVNITGSSNNFETGVIVDKGDHNDMWWDWIQNRSTGAHYEFVLSASKSIPTDEVVNIAKSVALR